MSTPILNRLSNQAYHILIQRLIASKSSAVVIGSDAYIINNSGGISLLGGGAMSDAQSVQFKLWLINEFDPNHKLLTPITQ